MKEKKKTQKKKSITPDWLVQGVLTKLGDTFDRLTGRGWNPSSNLATSKLIEKLKTLVDSEVRDLGKEGKFVPHNIRLKIQWDKFSTDSDDDLRKLEHELHAAAIDHINDRRYHTYAPLNIEIKTDYFTEGVRLLGSFGKYADKEEAEAEMNVTIPNLNVADLAVDGKMSVILNQEEVEINQSTFIVKLSHNGKDREVELDFTKRKRMSVGRSKGNDLSVDDSSVSKRHASLVLDSEKNLLVADVGSTNGTFVGEERIAYGKAFMIKDGTPVKFGTVEVMFERVGEIAAPAIAESVEVESNVLPTVAAIDVNGQESSPQLKPTEAFNSSDKNVPVSASTEFDKADEHVEIDEKENSDRSGDSSSSEDSKGESIGDSNIDETQDWEI